MRRVLLALVVLILAGIALAGCAQAPAPTPLPDLKAPTVQLSRVEVASYFPWPAPPPTVAPTTPTPPPPPAVRVPLVLAYVFDINNPNPYPVTLDGMKFTTEFEAAPNEYFAVNTPFVNEKMSLPGGATNQLRVTVVYDSQVVPGNLAVTSGARLAALKLSPGAVVQNWWEKIGDFSFGIKVTNGTAEFKSEKGDKLVTFEGKFPK